MNANVYLQIVGRQLLRIETTVEKLVNKLEKIITNFYIIKEKVVVKLTDQVPIKSNSDMTRFKLQDLSSKVMEVLVKKFKDTKLQTL